MRGTERFLATMGLVTAMASLLVFGLCSGCSQDQASVGLEDTPESETESESAVVAGLPVWSPETDCSMCHDAESASLADTDCTASSHATLTCVTCHTETDGLARIHAEAGSAAPEDAASLDYPVSTDACLGCHGSYAALAEKTASSTALADPDGTVVNPHAIPVNDGHTTTPGCTDCHQVHRESEVAERAMEYCKGCHHTGELECYTCHE